MSTDQSADDPLAHFRLEVRALPDPDGIAPAIRVRQWLKQGLRRFFLKVEAMAPPPAPDQTEGTPP